MSIYKIRIEETLAKIVNIEAPSYEEAERIVAELYEKEEIVLTGGDFVETTLSNAEEET